MNYLDTLNDAQRDAVTTLSKYTRVVAGAGSGKTRVLITRIAYMIEELGYPASSICAITFTNKAANEMKNRLIGMLGDLSSGVHISTIHSLCVTILRQDINVLGYPRNFTILDSDDQKAILKEAYPKCDLDQKAYTYGSMLNYIGAMKGESITPKKAMEMAYHNPMEIKKAKVYAYYVERQQQLFALDFDDLLLWTVRLFHLDCDKLTKWQKKFHHILVDEFQDVDRVQYELIRLLAGEHNEVYVVGDPDQTIYTWRGADVNIIMNFGSDFEGAETVYLNQNYRSTKNILDGANSLIDYNKNRLKKDLFTAGEEGEKIYLYNAASEEIEAAFVVEKMVELHNKRLSYRDMAVLYRSNYLSRNLEKVLAKFHVPYKIYGGLRFYDRMEIKDSLCYLRLLVKGDDLAFKRVVNSPKRGVGNSTLDTIAELAEKDQSTYLEAVRNHSDELKGKAKKELLALIDHIDSWKAKIGSMSIVDLLDMVLDESGYRKMLNDMNEPERIENIKELQNDIMYFEKNNPDSSLDEYLQTIALITDKDVYDEGDYVSLMTVHSAKGLEFDTVFVISLCESVFPNERSMNEGNNGIEEERRLAYVALTRAKRLLFITSSQGFSYVLNAPKTPSRFISEIDESTIQRIGVQSEKVNYYEEYKNGREPIDLSEGSCDFKRSDLVRHKVFGEGVVLSVEGQMIKVAFGMPHGIKTLLATHPSISKIEN